MHMTTTTSTTKDMTTMTTKVTRTEGCCITLQKPQGGNTMRYDFVEAKAQSPIHVFLPAGWPTRSRLTPSRTARWSNAGTP